MPTPLILALAFGAGAASDSEIVIVNDQPSISISLARYDLARGEDVMRLRHRIAHAAKIVCDTGEGGIAHIDAEACRDGAVANADAQLASVLAYRGTAAAAASSIAVTAPTN